MHAIINGRRQLNDIEWDQQRKKKQQNKNESNNYNNLFMFRLFMCWYERNKNQLKLKMTRKRK